MLYGLKLALTLVVAGAGGTCFFLFSLPLPWMLGSMCAVALMAIAHGPVVSVKRIRPPLATVIGVTLGSAFQTDTFSQAMNWIPLTLSTIISTILVGSLGSYYLHRVAKFDVITAFFSAMPAGVYEMTHQGGLMGGDERRIAITQAVRIFMIVLLVPIAFRWLFELGASGAATIGEAAGLQPRDFILLTLCAAGGWPLARWLRLPNPPLIGPLLASATAHLLGLTATAPPYYLVSIAQVFLGASIGGQFIGATFREIRSIAVHGFMLIPIMLVICVGVAWIATEFSYFDLPTVFLAIAPGGGAPKCH